MANERRPTPRSSQSTWLLGFSLFLLSLNFASALQNLIAVSHWAQWILAHWKYVASLFGEAAAYWLASVFHLHLSWLGKESLSLMPLLGAVLVFGWRRSTAENLGTAGERTFDRVKHLLRRLWSPFANRSTRESWEIFGGILIAVILSRIEFLAHQPANPPPDAAAWLNRCTYWKEWYCWKNSIHDPYQVFIQSQVGTVDHALSVMASLIAIVVIFQFSREFISAFIAACLFLAVAALPLEAWVRGIGLPV